MTFRTIDWTENKIRLIDQTALPGHSLYLNIETVEDLAEAICSLRVRGAPAIGIAAALGVALAANNHTDEPAEAFISSIRDAMDVLGRTRPTAVNLFWALNRMEQVLNQAAHLSPGEIRERLLQEALDILNEDRLICHQLGVHGAELIPDAANILTHCNAGALATSEYGTALAVIYEAVSQGKEIKVYADETRPLLQGARLTSWELNANGISVTVLCDSAAAFLMQRGEVDCVIVGADRIAANGDVANKVGTYMLSVLAEKHEIPFYVVAPVSSFDLSISSGSEIPIEQRDRSEVAAFMGRITVPEAVPVYNPAFDVTPNHLVTAIVTEKGVLTPPFELSIRKVLLEGGILSDA
ncbi:S-methyl-5-thioribose-1-phosphate isomerase [bacterium]|nr:S-methyl-5-thioribose-1-phosphate isomerase [bacterium]